MPRGTGAGPPREPTEAPISARAEADDQSPDLAAFSRWADREHQVRVIEAMPCVHRFPPQAYCIRLISILKNQAQ